jgi:hypothetical protein
MEITDKKLRIGLFWCKASVIIDLYFCRQKGRGCWCVGFKWLE